MDSRIVLRASTLMILMAGACGPILAGSGESTYLPTATLQAVPTGTDIAWFPPTDTPEAPSLAAPEPTAERKPGVGEILYQDQLASAVGWSIPDENDGAVSASEGGLTLAAEPGAVPVVTLLQGVVFQDVYAEITARPSLCRDGDAFGLLFRAPNDLAYYRFAVSCNGTANAERISLGPPRALQPPTPSADAPQGAPGEVRLGVWSVGPDFRFFLNGRYQFMGNDRSYSSGHIGVFAYAADQTPVVVTFSGLKVRTIATDALGLTPSP
jgi:hypothetical protein